MTLSPETRMLLDAERVLTPGELSTIAAELRALDESPIELTYVRATIGIYNELRQIREFLASDDSGSER